MLSTTVVFVVVSFLAVALIFGSSFSRFAHGVPVFGPAGEKKCTSDFFSRTCCWIDTDTEAYKKFCETCIDQGDGTYADCNTTEGPVAFEPPSTVAPGGLKVEKGGVLSSRENLTNALPPANTTGTLPPGSIIKVSPSIVGSATNSSNSTGTSSLGNIIKVPVNHTNTLPTGNNTGTPPPSSTTLAGQQLQTQQATGHHHHKGSSTSASKSNGNSTAH
jgi:hypothetical protein